ncbi:GGDEF domain-containing protein [Ramlibacter sp. H39-3-26]|uniref:GGDEF domain-containing protein n=1 Tax=Curvibacter soli TaxID=3031331 RepID=UPI0023DA253D|nr:GGDEF domain-containing protein [Ramlibacter sp. H39-3-26]MDF1485132.1 GGDEF domain-containing protein [Ramlibacter sp. H39-3-26]
MKPVLKHLVEMTGHRDHSRLEISVVTALQQLMGTQAVRTLEVFNLHDVLYVRPLVFVHDGVATESGFEASVDPQREPLDNFPALAQSIKQRQETATAQRDDGMHVLWLPVWMHNQPVACLEIAQPTPFSRQERDVIHAIFRVYQNYQNLLDYSERDALTGLFNRKTFDEQFARHARAQAANALREPAAAAQTGEAADVPPAGGGAASQWLAVVDIDHFKLVNDRFGHLYGDEVLILIANLLKTSFRAQDRIFRFGGEEFVVLLRSATLEAAHRIFNRFRAAVEQNDFPQVGRVTVSIGFVEASTGMPTEILGRADQALYYAKENGRNRVCYYDELVSAGLLTTTATNDSVELF